MFVHFSSRCGRETIHFTFLYLLFSSFCFSAARQDFQQTARGNCVFDIKKEGEGINSLRYATQLIYRNCLILKVRLKR